ncbi:MAG: helix-turn-helix transcriptional regulator [Clostridia bacterium]|nr:helix-turn-helix transcriptional regulator [Clostridia bacterium]
MNNVKEILPQNLVRLRTEHGLTQSKLAEKLNYTDKSISKWERGEAIPPVDVLKDISDLYGVSLDFLVSNTNEDNITSNATIKKEKANKLIITLLAVSLVWIIATVLFAYGIMFAKRSFWVLFIIAVPTTIVVLLIFNSIWGKKKYTYIIISALIWSALAAIYLAFLSTPSQYNLWAIFIIGIPLQIATILWSQLKKTK